MPQFSLQIFEKLDNYVTDESFDIRVFILTTPPGRGKSTLLAHWLIFIQILLPHF